jgi:serine/threonine-protein kinase
MGHGEIVEAKVGAEVDGRYRVRREVARGGMGLVFEAEHIATGQRIALKVLSSAHIGRGPGEKRLLREARILGALRHPNVVRVQDAGTCALHGPYLALELIDGRPLDGILLTRTKLPIAQAVALTSQLASALDHVHRSGFVHRDLKPANILIAHTPIGDQLELLDFGVAKVASGDDDPDVEKLTQMGEMLGTREYMSPEQLMNGTIDARTDVYGAAAVLYECLGGEVPYSGHVSAIITQMLRKVRPAPLRARRPEIPDELDAVVMKGLELDPADRWPSIAAFARACVDAVEGAVPRLALLDLRPDSGVESIPGEPNPKPTMAARAPARRQHTRAPYVTPVRLLLPEGIHVDGRTEDLSEGGILVVTKNAVPTDRTVSIRLPLPGDGRVVEVTGVVRWSRERRNVFASGLEFVGLADAARVAVRAYVSMMTGAPST